MPKVSNYKKLLLVLAVAINLTIGFYRYQHVVNFLDFSDTFKERNTIRTAYPLDFSSLYFSLLNDPRWLSNLFYILVAVLSTSFSIYLLFGKKMVAICLYCYGFLVLLCGFFVLLSLLTGNYKLGFGVAQEIKNMSQSPIVSFIIIGLCYFSSTDFKSASE